MTEIRTTSSTGAEKGVKPERYDLIPVDALAAVARLYGQGAKKYAEHNWRAGYEFSKSYAALQRHANQFWNGEDVDPEMGESHLAAVIFHAMTLLTFQQEHPEFDDRYSSKSVSSDRSGLLDILKPKATSEELYKSAKEALQNAPQDPQVVFSTPIYHGKEKSMKVSNQPVNVIRKLLGIRAPSAEAIAGFDAEVIERNKKAFKEEQERAALEISMRAHPAGKGLKKDVEDKPKPICARCKYPIGHLGHVMGCQDTGE